MLLVRGDKIQCKQFTVSRYVTHSSIYLEIHNVKPIDLVKFSVPIFSLKLMKSISDIYVVICEGDGGRPAGDHANLGHGRPGAVPVPRGRLLQVGDSLYLYSFPDAEKDIETYPKFSQYFGSALIFLWIRIRIRLLSARLGLWFVSRQFRG